MTGIRGFAALFVMLVLGTNACAADTSSPAPSTTDHQSTPAPETTTATPPTVQTSPTDPAPTAPGWGSVALDLHAQTVFGFGVGYVPADELLGALSEHLGPVTNDTGWYVMPRLHGDDPTIDCLAEVPSRVLHWGDLSFAMFRSPFGVDGDFLWNWSVGDPPSSQATRREPHQPDQPAATGLRTAEGISVGSPTSDLDDSYGEQIRTDPGPQHPQNTDTVLEVDQDTGSALLLRTRRGTIEGIAASFAFAGVSGLDDCSTSTVTQHLATTNVILVGDSLAEQAAPYLQPFFAPNSLVRHVYAGTAPCDWLGKNLAIQTTSVVVISFSGNSLTSCMTDDAGGPLQGQDVVTRYRLDVSALIAEALYVGAKVLLVGQPVHDGAPSSNDVVTELDVMYQDLAGATHTEFVDAGAAVENPDGTFAFTLPCLQSEPRCVLAGMNVVRSDDGVHFCPGSAPVGPCQVYASGAFRFAKAIEQAVRDL